MAERASETRRWWLGGVEVCGFCLQTYVLEVEIRCVDCDRPMCPMCSVVVAERVESFCVECGGEGCDDGESAE